MDKLKVDGSHKKWNYFRRALLMILHKDRVNAIESRLKSFREQMVLSILSNLRYSCRVLLYRFIPTHPGHFCRRATVEAAKQQQTTILEHVSHIAHATQRFGPAFLAHMEIAANGTKMSLKPFATETGKYSRVEGCLGRP